MKDPDEIQLLPGGGLRKPVTVWVVRVGDDLYVRSYKGRGSAWFRHALAHPQGRVRMGGLERDVRFVEGDDGRADEIDAAFRSKYGRYGASYVSSMVSPSVREATLRLSPDTPWG